jgi:hypothetical protein
MGMDKKPEKNKPHHSGGCCQPAPAEKGKTPPAPAKKPGQK